MGENTVKLLFDTKVLEDSLGKKTARTGVYFVAYNLLRNMLRRDDFAITPFAADEGRLRRYLSQYFPEHKDIPVVSSLENAGDADAFFSPGDPCGHWVKPFHPAISCFFVAYDIIPLIFPHYFHGSQYAAVWNMLDRLRWDNHVFAISQSTKNDIVRMSGHVDPDAITVIPLGANEFFYPNTDPAAFRAVREKYNIPGNKRYILSLCTKEPRKNIVNVVRAFIEFIDRDKIEDLVFVLAGGTWGIFKEELRKCVANLGDYADRIVNTGYVDDADVASLYSNAMWFVYTSRYEGFGLPPLEAMQCGCPVVTSFNSSLPEVVGDAALTVDSEDIDAHVAAYRRYYSDPALREEYSRKGIERAKRFSWARGAEIVCDTIRDTVARKRATPIVSVFVGGNASAATADFPALKRCVESVLEQTYVHRDVLILDCGFDADCSRALDAFAANTPGVALRRAAGKTLCQAYADALEQAGGAYAAFLGGGFRYASPKCLDALVAKGLEHDADLVYGDSVDVGGGGATVREGDAGRLPLGGHFVRGACLLRGEAIRRAGGFAPEYGAAAFDELAMRMLRDGMRLVHAYAVRVEWNPTREDAADAALCARAFYETLGKAYGMTPDEARLLRDDAYLRNLSDIGVMELAKKLPPALGGAAMLETMFTSRHAAGVVDAARRKELADGKYRLFGFIPCTVRYTGDTMANTTWYSLFGKIPFLKVRRREGNRATHYLFGVFPLLRMKSKR